MTTESATAVHKPRRWVLRAFMGLLLGLLLLFVALRVVQSRADGPWDLLPGGELRSGELVTEPAAGWSSVHGKTIELQLLEPMGSRFTGIMVHDGELYIPCDLGYMWGRMSGQTRRVLHLVYLLKRWHKDALEDGRVVLRIDGNRYLRQAVRVTEPQLLASLRKDLEALAREWMAPEVLGPPPTEGPRDIWFFRLDPRSA